MKEFLSVYVGFYNQYTIIKYIKYIYIHVKTHWYALLQGFIMY